MKHPALTFLIAIAACQLMSASAFACSVCYGEPDSPMSRGLTWAVIALAGIIGVVLAGVAGFFVHVNRRTNVLQQAGPAPEKANLPS